MDSSEKTVSATIISGVSPNMSISLPHPCQLILNSLGQVSKLQICLHLTQEVVSVINSKEWDKIFLEFITGELEDGSKFTITVDIVIGFKLSSTYPDSVIFECIVSAMQKEGKNNHNHQQNKKWLIQLSNVRLWNGDSTTTQILPVSSSVTTDERNESIGQSICNRKESVSDSQDSQGENKGTRNTTDIISLNKIVFHKIVFQWKSRVWELVDEKHRFWSKNNANNVRTPILSGTLKTDCIDGDTFDSIGQSAWDISYLLSFALGRDIKPCVISLLSNDELVSSHEFSVSARPFNENSTNVVDNWELGNIKTFIESSEPIIATELEWWCKTLALYAEGASNKLPIDIQLAILNALLERVSSKWIGEKKLHEIDENIPKLLKGSALKESIQECLSKYIPSWPLEKTNALLGEIRRYNAGPSFPEKVIRSCGFLGIPVMSKARINFRNTLLHTLDFHKDLKTDEDKVEYLFELKGMIALMILKKLNFEGKIYLEHYCKQFEHHPVNISDLLQEPTIP